MKRFVLLVCAFAILLSGCQTLGFSNIFNSQSSDEGFMVFSEYEKFVQKTFLPSKFVHFSKISILGSFHGALFYSDTKYKTYQYTITDANMSSGPSGSTMIYFNVLHGKKNWRYSYDLTLDSLPDGMEDMRQLTVVPHEPPKVAMYSRHGLEYHYLGNGALGWLVWHEGDIEFKLGISNILAIYPTDAKETILSRLLSIDENVSKAAFEELKAHMKANG